jgi:hypothetical protein
MATSDYVYMKVTNDEYELPVCVRDNLTELAEACGYTKGSISSEISHAKHGKKTLFYKVYVGEEDGS